ncbi:MAG: nicotinate-nucleotide adenylyltransferase [Bacteroidales bacterium]|nr:nicotinate-nucleotide adenylyltransferase [Bacteroidales bacterium]
MNVGLFFGSFNPVHIGHMALANYFVEFTNIDQLWFIVSPHNPLKNKKSLISDQLRLEMVELAIDHDERFTASDIEFRMPKPSYTIDTLTYLSEKHPKNNFILLMGADGLNSFHKWKNNDQIIRQYHRYIYPRRLSNTEEVLRHENITLLDNAPQIEISSSFIRKAIKENKDIRYFLPVKVSEFIERLNLYK